MKRIWMVLLMMLALVLPSARAAQTSMPADGYLGSGSRTTAEFQQGIEDVASVVMELLGGRAEKGVTTLSSDAFTPSVDYAVFPIQPESSTTDDLATIVTTSARDGSLVAVRSYSASNTITIKHGTGNLYMADGADYAISATGDYVVFILRGSNWYELFRTEAGRIKVLAGAKTETEVTVASGMLAITQMQNKVEGEGAASDNLDGISSTFKGNLAIIRATNASHVITVRNNQTPSAGYYKILTADGSDLALDSLTKYVMLHKDVSGSAWREIFRGGFSSSTSFSVSSVSGSFSMNGGSLTSYACDTSAGAGTGTLSATPADGRIINVWATSANYSLTIQTTGGELIYFPDGTTATSFVLRNSDGVPMLQAVAGGWRII